MATPQKLGVKGLYLNDRTINFSMDTKTTEGDFMKNKAKLLGFITLVAVIGFSMTTCNNNDICGCGDGDGGDEGRFILTGIPSKYNGKWAMFFENYGYLYGGQNITISQSFADAIYTGSPISGGSVSLPMWKCSGTKTVSEYYGNDTAYSCLVFIVNSAKIGGNWIPSIDNRYFAAVKFSNGSASKVWSEGIVSEPPPNPFTIK